MSKSERTMNVGVGRIVEDIRDSKLSLRKCLCELFDNSLDAAAKNITVTVDDGVFVYHDDGIGCDEIDKMVDIGQSHDHGGRKSGHYGSGGKKALVKISRGTTCEIITVSGGVVYGASIDWQWMIETNSGKYNEEKPRQATKGEHGTTLTAYNCVQFRDIDDLCKELGYLYADSIKAGARISLDINGKPKTITPYVHPPFSDEAPIDFMCDGHHITGFCGVVKEGITNPYPGWTIHWGPHRVLCTTTEPADKSPTNRIQGHVYLPDGWTNRNGTKDDFAEEPTELFALIRRDCTKIIELAESASMTFETEFFMGQVTQHLNQMIDDAKERIKGRRPGRDVKPGAVKPTGNGSPHKKFTTHQPGDKSEISSYGGQIPLRFTLGFDDTMLDPWTIEIKGKRDPEASIVLNRSNPAIAGFIEREEDRGLASWCFLLLADHLSHTERDQARFGFAEECETKRIFHVLTESKKTPVLV